MQRLVQEYREQNAREATAGNVNFLRKRDQCGGHTMKLTEDLAKELIIASTAKLGDDFHARRLQENWQKKVITFPVNLYGTGVRH